MKCHFKLPLVALASALSIAATGVAAQTTTTDTAPMTTPAPADPAMPADPAAPAAQSADTTTPAKMTREEKKAKKEADKAAKKAAKDPSMTPAATAPATTNAPDAMAPADATTPAAPAAPMAGAPAAPMAGAPAAPMAGTPAASPAAAPAAANPAVGGAPMDAAKTIVANAATAPNLTTLVKAVQAAGLAETLSGPGPFTVFAPTNDAFGRLAPGTVDTLLKPENKPLLVKALTYHVVSGNISASQLLSQIEAGGGKATLTTVNGAPLTATKEAQAVVLTDVNGNKSYIETPDVRQSNGVVHVVNGVLLPKLN